MNKIKKKAKEAKNYVDLKKTEMKNNKEEKNL